MTFPIRIGARGSALSLAQTGQTRLALARALGVPDAEIDQALPIVVITTTGDRVQDRRLLEIGGKALFTKEIEEALLDGRIDLAIHSMKDVPADQPPGLAIAAIPEREDASDAFVSAACATFDDLPVGGRLGTASLRRQAQALALRPDLHIEMLRGNVDTRLRRAAEGDFDGILLATAGLNRLGRADAIRERLSFDRFLPAPGQGALAVQSRESDAETDWAAALNHPLTAQLVAAERGAMTALEGSCRTAVGAHAVIAEGHLRLTTEMLSPDGSARWRRSGEIDLAAGPDAARALGLELGAQVHAAAGDQEVDPRTLDGTLDG
ncbi:MAG: hydroxymethylbilane synthase [Brevundimonas sp.]|nr:MAG: hydroxymethylbilane synthase [Brevundimonas sp.]